MKRFFTVLIFTGLCAGSVMAVEEIESTNNLFDQYVEVTAAIQSAGWNYLGCASGKSICTKKAQSRGYSESKLVYMACTPRSTTEFSCFAR